MAVMFTSTAHSIHDLNMPDRIPIALAWSGGKDCSLALHRLLQDEVYEVKCLLSTFNAKYRRLSMHGIREALIEAQAESAGLALKKVYVEEGTNAEYELRMGEAMLALRAEGISTLAFGDIFLEDLRTYRERQLERAGMQGVFPLWKENTKELLTTFIALGFEAWTCCVNDAFLKEEWAGRKIDALFAAGLPPGVDPCGENGEYHSFCADGPVFSFPVPIEKGETVYRPLELNLSLPRAASDPPATLGFWYTDFLIKTD